MDAVISMPALKAALRLSLSATSKTSLSRVEGLSISTTSEGPLQRKDPRLQKLVEGILFSRKFILTYQVVIAALLLSFAAFHWGGKVRRSRRRRNATRKTSPRHHRAGVTKEPKDQKSGVLEDGSGDTSSSSSTLEGTASPLAASNSKVNDNERSPLLKKQRASTQRKPRLRAVSSVRGWLMYQPRPIPIINKSLPSNATTFIVLAFVALNVFYTFFRVPLSISMLFVFADRASLVFVANLPLLYLLAAKNQPIKLLTGYSYESLNIIHRRLGEIMCVLALLHSAGMIGVWYTVLRPVGLSFVAFVLKRIILLGTGAFIAYELIYFTSLGSFRQRWYELFLILHVILQAAALVLLWFHHHGSRVYVGIALGIFLIDRLVFRLMLNSRTLKAQIIAMEDQETVQISVKIPIKRDGNILQRALLVNVTQGWKSTEHVFLTIPGLSRKHWIQAHPFTIASAAPSATASEGSLDLIIRAQDGFSRDILTHLQTCIWSHDYFTIRLDGPYGSQFAVDLVQDSDLVVVVAGGSGIAVAWPLLQSLITESNVDLENARMHSNQKKILFVWVVQRENHVLWIGENRIDALRAQGIDVVIPKPTAECGRPDIGAVVQTWIGQHYTDTISNPGRVLRTGVVCSGPDGMNRVVRNTCSRLVAAGRDISVEIEKFGW